MTIYCDTSVLVAALTLELEHPEAADWLSDQAAGTLSASDWVATELASALSLKVRSGSIADQERRIALAGWAVLANNSFEIVQLEPSDFHTAIRFLDRPETGLRAGDALHLAIAHNRGFAVATLDKKVVSAGSLLGIQMVSVVSAH